MTPQVLLCPLIGDVVPWRSWRERGEGKERKGAPQSCPDTMTFRLSLETLARAAEVGGGGWLARRSEGAVLVFTSWAGQVATLSSVFAGKQLPFCS